MFRFDSLVAIAPVQQTGPLLQTSSGRPHARSVEVGSHTLNHWCAPRLRKDGGDSPRDVWWSVPVLDHRRYVVPVPIGGPGLVYGSVWTISRRYRRPEVLGTRRWFNCHGVFHHPGSA